MLAGRSPRPCWARSRSPRRRRIWRADRSRCRVDRGRGRHRPGQPASQEGAVPIKGKGRILEENRELLRVEIGNVLEEMERQALTQTDTIIGRIRADLSSTAEQRAEAEAVP